MTADARKVRNAPAKQTANADVTKIRMLKPDVTVRKMLNPAIVRKMRKLVTAKTQKPVTADAKMAKIANARITKKI